MCHNRKCSRYDYAAGRITYDSAVRLIDAIGTQGLSPEWIIETHVHADHLFGVRYLQDKLGGKIGRLRMFEKQGWDRQKRNFNDVTLRDKCYCGSVPCACRRESIFEA
ncbi:MAG: MBL fold metallo-hydrolase [Paracoccaceae bacterium]